MGFHVSAVNMVNGISVNGLGEVQMESQNLANISLGEFNLYDTLLNLLNSLLNMDKKLLVLCFQKLGC